MIPNGPVFSVSELSQSLKSSIEEKFPYVHVRGELSDVKIAASGHCYARLKDANAVLDVIVWKTSMARLSVKPEEGLEVVATGKLTTYPGRSSYQLIIDRIEVAGEGALLKLIEERRKKLAAEGLFDPARKRVLPAFPTRIGVITSPTGAVIRDILHRLADRYPCEVWLWPVLVQGEGAAGQITAALNHIAAMPDKPDVVIVARGGGALEDLMAFNDEALVRAAANCPVPLISAVGHETDTTLIDWASDRRAPTPTAAAEMATPERGAILAGLSEYKMRMGQSLRRGIDEAGQRLDHGQFKLTATTMQGIERAQSRLDRLVPRSPADIVRLQAQTLASLIDKSGQAMRRRLDEAARLSERLFLQLSAQSQQPLDRAQSRLDRLVLRTPNAIVDMYAQQVNALANRLEKTLPDRLARDEEKVKTLTRVLSGVSFEATLERGFVLVRDESGKPLTSADMLHKDQNVALQFKGGKTRTASVVD